MARPKKPPKPAVSAPDLILHMRLKPGQKARWESAAARDRRTLPDWVRITLDDASEESPGKPKE